MFTLCAWNLRILKVREQLTHDAANCLFGAHTETKVATKVQGAKNVPPTLKGGDVSNLKVQLTGRLERAANVNSFELVYSKFRSKRVKRSQSGALLHKKKLKKESDLS